MVYGYENLNVAYQQISELCPNGIYGNLKIDKIYTQKKYKKTPGGRTLPPAKKDDAEYQLLQTIEKGDIIITSSLTNFSLHMEGIFTFLRSLGEKQVRIKSIVEAYDSDLIDYKTFFLFCCIRDSCVRIQQQIRRHGIEQAIEKGNTAKKEIKRSDFSDFDDMLQQYNNGTLTKTDWARTLGISRPTLDRLIYEPQQPQQCVTFYSGAPFKAAGMAVAEESTLYDIWEARKKQIKRSGRKKIPPNKQNEN